MGEGEYTDYSWMKFYKCGCYTLFTYNAKRGGFEPLVTHCCDDSVDKVGFERIIHQGEQLSSEIPCISIPEREKGGRLKKMNRKVETCTRCDVIAGVFYNGTHDIQTPVVLPYYMERQSEYLLDCTRCKKINRSI